MGGKNPTIVLADADFDAAVENVVNAAFFSTGQKCTATSRAIVEAPIYDRFLEAVVERTAKLKVGDGLESGVEIGPAMDQAQLETMLRYIELGTREAGPPKTGGQRLTGEGYDKGYFVAPTIFADVTPEMTHRPGRDLRTGTRGDEGCAISRTRCALPTTFLSAFGLHPDLPT